MTRPVSTSPLCLLLLMGLPGAGQVPITFTHLTDELYARYGTAYVSGTEAVAWFDLDSDGDLDLMIHCTRQCRNEVWRNLDGRGFDEVQNLIPGLASTPEHIGGIATSGIGDFTGNGLPDILEGISSIFPQTGRNRLWRLQDSGRLDDVAEQSGLTAIRRFSSPAVDFDRDGYLDTYLVYGDTYFGDSFAPHFQRVADSGISAARSYRTLTMVDLNNDTWIDMLCDNDEISRFSAFYINRSNREFIDVADALGFNSVSVAPVVPADLNQDGWFDLYGGYDTLSHTLHINTSTSQSHLTFFEGTARAAIRGQEPIPHYVAGAHTAGDYDNDGWCDLYMPLYPPGGGSQAANNRLYLNLGDGRFVNIAYPANVDDANSTAACGWADFNHDGFLEPFTGNINAVPTSRLWLSNGNANSWAMFDLEGLTTTRMANGTRVILADGPWAQLREVGHTTVGKSQSAFPVHFGLGQRESVDALIIRWLGGTSIPGVPGPLIHQVYTGLPLCEYVELLEGDLTMDHRVNHADLIALIEQWHDRPNAEAAAYLEAATGYVLAGATEELETLLTGIFGPRPPSWAVPGTAPLPPYPTQGTRIVGNLVVPYPFSSPSSITGPTTAFLLPPQGVRHVPLRRQGDLLGPGDCSPFVNGIAHWATAEVAGDPRMRSSADFNNDLRVDHLDLLQLTRLMSWYQSRVGEHGFGSRHVHKRTGGVPRPGRYVGTPWRTPIVYATQTPTPTPVLRPPSGLSATDFPVRREFRLSWFPASGHVGYRLYGGADTVDYGTALRSLPADALTSTLSYDSVPPSTNYKVGLRAVAFDGRDDGNTNVVTIVRWEP